MGEHGAAPVADRKFEIEGKVLGFPTSFRDGSSLMGTFLVPEPAAARLLADCPFETAEILPGRTLFLLNCIHYTDTDCGIYEEIAFAVLARHHTQGVSRLGTIKSFITGGDNVFTYTWRLGVTTKLSQQAGLQMWGFPKQMADLRWDQTAETTSMTWMEDDELVMRFTVPSGGKKQAGPISAPVLCAIDGHPHVGYLTQSYGQVAYKPGGGQIELGENHSVSEELRTLGLPSKPLLAIWNGHIEFEMSAPIRIKHEHSSTNTLCKPPG